MVPFIYLGESLEIRSFEVRRWSIPRANEVKILKKVLIVPKESSCIKIIIQALSMDYSREIFTFPFIFRNEVDQGRR